MKKTIEEAVEDQGFTEIAVEEGMTDSTEASNSCYTENCSGSRSDCCTRTCSQDETFAGTTEDWEAFLYLEGGDIQY